MRGLLHIIPTGTMDAHKLVHLSDMPTLSLIQDSVGGPAELVPQFETIIREGMVRNCLVLCHEEGKAKGLPPNDWATALWTVARNRIYAPKVAPPVPEPLLGPIAVFTGDGIFMEHLRRRG